MAIKLSKGLFTKYLVKNDCCLKINFLEPYFYNTYRPHFISRSFLTLTSINFNSKKDNSRGKKRSELMNLEYFKSKEKNKESFLEAVNMYKTRERHLRGHVEFIYAALSYLEEFGVHRELEVYKALLNIMPKGKMIPRSIWQAEFYHYPKHQECAIEVLEVMGVNGVIPDSELEAILVNTFGEWGGPTKLHYRMMYWMPKFKHATPWPLPEKFPEDTLELAILAIKQITSVDSATKIDVLKTSEVEDAIDDTWIVSAISPSQQELIKQHPSEESIKVEGPFGILLQDVKVGYFILRAEAKPPPPRPSRDEVDNVGNIFVWMLEEENVGKELLKTRSVHEQDDGSILSVCATGTSSRDSLLSWIRILEKSNPALSNIPVLFTQSSPIGDIILVDEEEKDSKVRKKDS